MKILITLDGSEFAETILQPITELAALSAAEVHIIEVVKPTASSTRWVQTPTDYPHALSQSMIAGVPGIQEALGKPVDSNLQYEERTRQAAEDYLGDIAARFFPKNTTNQVVLGEDPAEAILGYARREDVDLIAIATHGRTGLARMLMGSVAGKLLGAGAAPLFLVRPADLN